MRALIIISVICLLIQATPALAKQGTRYEVKLLTNQSVEVKVADLVLEPKDGGYSYDLTLAHDPFDDFFLAMRPFKCLTDKPTDRNHCYLVYPYENKRFISEGDLTDLEYDLLFIRRSAKDYGIDPWFGSYYKLKWVDERLEGVMYEVDLDILISPPKDGNLRPITESDLTLAEKEAQWLPSLQIVPVN